MTPEERTKAIVAATISKETICQFGTPKDWAWLALYVTPAKMLDTVDVLRGIAEREGFWFHRIEMAYRLLKRIGAKKRGIKLALARLEQLERRYSKLMLPYFLKQKSVYSKGKFSKQDYRRLVLLELAKGTRECDLKGISSKCVVRIIADTGPVHIGQTNASKGRLLLMELQTKCLQLNTEAKHGTPKA